MGGLCGLRRLDRNVPIDAAYAGSLPFFSELGGTAFQLSRHGG